MVKNLKYWLAGFSAIFVLAALYHNGLGDSLGITNGYAQGGALNNNITGTIYSTVSQLLGMLMLIIQFFFHVINAIVPIVMDERLLFSINAAAGNEQGALLQLWDFNRDIVNIVFAVMLVAGAIMTIIKADASIIQQYYKQFFLAIILVNFSWFFPRVILDVSSALTVSIYQIPSVVLGDDQKGCKVSYKDANGKLAERDCSVIVRYVFLPQDADKITLVDDTGADTGWHSILNMIFYCDATMTSVGDLANADDCADLKDTGDGSTTFAGGQYNRTYTMLNYITMNYIRFNDLDRLHEFNQKTSDKTFTSVVQAALFLITQIVFTLFIMFMITLVTVAIFIAMAIRMVILWLSISFMPYYFLGLVFPHWKPNP